MIVSALLGYLAGSIPFGLLLTKLAGLGDIRKTGSGNIGATNVLRTGNKALALLTLLLDGGKGACVILLLASDLNTALLIGLAAILGHVFPVWLKFKGGKGVATSLGVLLAAAPLAGLAAALTWLAVAFTSRLSSLAALCATAITPVVTLIVYGAAPASITALIAALIIWRHKENIKRLRAGTEPKVGKKNAST